MLRRQPIADSKIIEGITRRLASCGVRAPSRVILACTNGQVTISGVIQYEPSVIPYSAPLAELRACGR
jgi:hypothetical protein